MAEKNPDGSLMNSKPILLDCVKTRGRKWRELSTRGWHTAVRDRSFTVAASMTPLAAAQISGTYRTAVGTSATFYYGDASTPGVTVPADITATFSGDNPTTKITATIHKPIIGALGDGTVLFPVGGMFPRTVTGTSTDGVVFRGELIPGTQYGFDWEFHRTGSELSLNGSVAWLGGRLEQTEIRSARLTPVPEPASVGLVLAGAAALVRRRRR